MKYSPFISTLMLLLTLPALASEESPFELIVETGTVWQSRNDIQIPPPTGTRLAIDEFNTGPFFHYRLEGFYRFNDKHALRALVAPSDIEVTGRANQSTVFNGKTFSIAQDLTIRYQFNSYRLSYIYGFGGFGSDQINLGFTAKIRNASTTFTQGDQTTTYDNVGFVPLLYFEYRKALDENWEFHFNMDAAAASQGRAIDAALKLRRKIAEKMKLGLGLRTLEGGADNDKVYTFSWFNYAVADLKIEL